MSLAKLHVLIMAGGAGTRFWPRSRRDDPKQFQRLMGERTLLEETVARVEPLCPRERVWVLTRRELEPHVAELLPWLPAEQRVAEPEGRDTAPCLVYAATRVALRDPEALLLVLPADHVIPDARRFCAAVRGAVESLETEDGLVTFGIRPTYPATGFGYIQRAAGPGSAAGDFRCHAVKRFREKPDEETARRYLEAGDCYWNAGIFLWRLATFHTALERWAPELAAGGQALADLGARLADDRDPDTERCFRALPRISIDFALMEKADNVRVIEAPFEWDDVGSWRALERHRQADGHGNITEGAVVLHDAADCTVLACEGRVVAVAGVQGLVIVDSPDALLVVPRERVEEVKALVEEIRQRGWSSVL